MSKKKSEMPRLVRMEVDMRPTYRRFCQWLKNNPLVKYLRHTRLNPYHTFLTEIKADNFDEAVKKAYARGKVQFLYKGTRYYAERHCSVDEEYRKYGKVLRGRGNVADRIPRDKNGHLDLLAEDPIMIAIMPIEGPSLYGHVGMQYRDRVINRLLTTIYTDSMYQTYLDYTEYYFIYPSQLGIEPKDIIRAMDKHNLKHSYDDFSLVSNNCSMNVVKVLEKLGINDINLLGPDKLGLRYASPGNNPFSFGLKAWCFKHGVHVHTEEAKEFDERYPVLDNDKRRDEQEDIRQRANAISGNARIKTRADAKKRKPIQVKKKDKDKEKYKDKKSKTPVVEKGARR